jgi:hypothetical protein
MAAVGSRLDSERRGASTGQGAKAQREGMAPLPPLEVVEPYVPALDSLEDISGWLGTFRERLRQARNDERSVMAAVIGELEARYALRRAELS